MWLNPQYLKVKRSISDLLLVHAAKPVIYQNRKQLVEQDILTGMPAGGVATELYDGRELVVSLTTHAPRLHFAHLAVATIMRQTVRPNRVVLWLGDDLDGVEIPIFLQMLCRHGLELRRCRNTRSYKKLLPALEAFPDSLIVTIDDDVLYEPDVLERLLVAHRRHPDCVVANRCAKITRDSRGTALPYAKWENPTTDTVPSDDVVPIGVEGVLYPPGILHSDVRDIDTAMALAPHADDLWFKVMTLRNGRKSCLSQARPQQPRELVDVPSAEFSSLYSFNELAGPNNDRQLAALLRHYSMTL